MSKNPLFATPYNHKIAALITASLFSFPCIVHADDFAELQRTKAMTLNLIQALVETGAITQEKADKLIADAEAKAQAAVAALPGPEFTSRYAQAPVARPVAAAPVASTNPASGVQTEGASVAPPEPVTVVAPTPQQLAAPVIATIPQTNPPDVGPDGKRVVHVAYIPESTKREMREQIKQEVLAQSKAERWGDPGTLPDWLSRVTVSGDLRFRDEYVKLDPNNTAAGLGFTDGVFSRAPDIVGGSLSGNLPAYDTQKNDNNLFLRARLNIDAKVNDNVSAGVSLTTGNTNSRTSLSQGLGQNFDNENVVINRAVIKIDPAPWVNISAGRMNNPFFGTDLVWADDLSFDGIAAKFKYSITPSITTFVTGGYFPLSMDNPGTSNGKALDALQLGLDVDLTDKTKFKLGTGFFDYHNIVGTLENDATEASVSDYVSRYEYPVGFRQMGNTLFILNAPDDPNVNWGLASKFREVDVTTTLDYAASDSMHVTWISDYVKNVGYNAHDIFERTGYKILDGRNTGFMEKILIGAPVIKERGNWNVSMAYRKLGSDAVLDAFNNPDFGFGGTNNKGSIFTANYGIYKNTWLTARWLSSDLLESSVPERAGSTIPTKLSVDMLQIELQARY
jgi:hypothetical protein